MRKLIFTVLLAAVGVMLIMAATARAAEYPINADKHGVAVKGYDTVAYFTESKPVKGDPNISYEWRGATWQFSSEQNRELFKSDPEKYAPQYGGY